MPPRVTLRITEGEPELVGKEFSYDERTAFIIGRSDECIPQIPDNLAHKIISRYHCQLDINPPDIRIRDFGSMNGTFVNGEKIGQRERHQSAEEGRSTKFPEYDLKDGDEIRLGKTVLRVHIKIPVACMKCSCEIADEEVNACERATGIFVCQTCFDEAQKSKKPVPMAPPKRLCSRCGKDVAKEVGPNRQGDYVCMSCRAEKEPDFAKLLIQKALEEHLKAGKAPHIGAAPPARAEGGALRSLADYETVKLLGRGGMGQVHLAKHKKTGQRVALKTMLPQVATDTQARDRFLREIEVTKALDHRNIVRLYEDGYSNGTFFFTLEYCDGGSLDRYVHARGGKLPVDEACDIIFEVLDGLEYAHTAKLRGRLKDGTYGDAKGAVHRDLKPGNIFLSGQGKDRVVKIGDFGLGKAFDLAGFSGQTRSGTAAGTPNFMPRQQVLNFKYSKPEVDVWAAAATLYHILCGPAVFPRDYSPLLDPWQTTLNTKPIPIHDRNPGIPPNLAKAIDRALIDDPSIVFKSAAEFKIVLMEARLKDKLRQNAH